MGGGYKDGEGGLGLRTGRRSGFEDLRFSSAPDAACALSQPESG